MMELKNIDKVEMGRRIRAKREHLGMSRETLAEKLDVSVQFINDVEYGNKGVSIKNLYWLSQILGISADYILAGQVPFNDKSAELMRAREGVMEILCNCNARQLDNFSQIAMIFTEGLTLKE